MGDNTAFIKDKVVTYELILGKMQVEQSAAIAFPFGPQIPN